MCSRLEKEDPNFYSGVRTFIDRYNGLQQRMVATPSIASVLHTFGNETGIYNITKHDQGGQGRCYNRSFSSITNYDVIGVKSRHQLE